MLAPTSRDAISEADFVKTYTDVALNMTLREIEYGILTTLVNPTSAKVGYQVSFKTSLFGDIIRRMEMGLLADHGKWWIQWESGLIMPELSGGKKLALSLTSPTRGDIYDNDGNIIAAEAEAVAIGVVPDEIADDQVGNLAGILTVMTGIPSNMIRDTIERGGGSYIPLGEVSAQTYNRYANYLNSFTGVAVNPYTSRYYYDGGIAPQVILAEHFTRTI